LEKSIPEAFNGESVGAPPIIIVDPISMLGGFQDVLTIRED
jgi:hypothetical protein